MKLWKGPYKPVVNILEAGLHILGWARCDENALFVCMYVVVLNRSAPGWCYLLFCPRWNSVRRCGF